MQVNSRIETAPALSDEHILWDKKTTMLVTGYASESGFYKAQREYGLPKPLKIGPRKSLWKKAEVLAWIDNLGKDATTA